MTRFIMQLLPISKNVNYNYSFIRGLHNFKSGRFNSLSDFTLFGLSNKNIEFPVLLNISRKIRLSVLRESEVDGDVTGVGLEDLSAAFPLREAVEIEERSEQFRNTLYPDSLDSILLEIKSCNSVKQLLGVLNNNVNNLKSEHYCQTILVLWDLWAQCCDVVVDIGRPVSIPASRYLSNNKYSAEEYILLSDLRPILLKALAFISNDLERLSAESLVCSILYSIRLGVSVQHPAIQALFTNVSTLLSMEDANQFPISALSRLTLALNDVGNDLWAKIFLIKTLPLLYKHFGKYVPILGYSLYKLSDILLLFF